MLKLIGLVDAWGRFFILRTERLHEVAQSESKKAIFLKYCDWGPVDCA
jgi:hypothetical protein